MDVTHLEMIGVPLDLFIGLSMPTYDIDCSSLAYLLFPKGYESLVGREFVLIILATPAVTMYQP